jgi:xylan 1,4-beta-xylosidase
MGSPANPTAAQIVTLQKAGQLTSLGKPEKLTTTKGKAVLQFLLPRQGVSLLKFDWQ